MLEVDKVYLARLEKAVVIGVFGQAIVTFHVPEGYLVFLEELQGVATLPPHFRAGPVVLAGQVAVGVLVPEVPFDACSAGHDVSPEAVLAGVVTGGIFGVSDQCMSRVTRLVAGYHPGLAGGRRSVDVVLGLAVDPAEIAPVGLQREARQPRSVAEQIVVVGAVVDHDVVSIWVVRPEVVGPGRLLLRGGVVDFFAEIPVQGQVVAEACDQLAVVEFSLDAQIAFVQQQLVLGFQRFEVQVHAELVGVLEDDLPLVEPRDIHSQTLVVGRVRKNVVIVAFDIERQEREDVHALGGKVVDRTDHAFALAVLPGGIAGPEVFDVRGPGFDQVVLVTVRFEIAVEVRVSEEVLRCVRPAFEEVLLRLGESQMVLADVLQQTLASEIPAFFVCGSYDEGPVLTVHKACTVTGILVVTDGDILAFPERDAVLPASRLAWRKMDPPLVAAIGARIGCVAVAGKIARNHIRLAAPPMREGHVETIIQKWIRARCLTGPWSIERESDLVPLLDFSRDLVG